MEEDITLFEENDPEPRNYHDLLSVLKNKVSTGAEILDATSELRMVEVPDFEHAIVAELMKDRIKYLFNQEMLEDRVNRDIVNQSLFVLGSYGKAEDVPFIFDIAQKDRRLVGPNHQPPGVSLLRFEQGKVIKFAPPETMRSHRFTDIVSFCLHDLFRLNPHQCERYSSESISVWTGLFKEVTQLAPVSDNERFYEGARCLEVLTSRLVPQELDAAVSCIQYEEDRRCYGKSIANQTKINIGFFEKFDPLWLQERKLYAEEVVTRLNDEYQSSRK